MGVVVRLVERDLEPEELAQERRVAARVGRRHVRLTSEYENGVGALLGCGLGRGVVGARDGASAPGVGEGVVGAPRGRSGPTTPRR